MSRVARTALLVLLTTWVAAPAAIAQVAVPPELEPWRGWALQGEEFRRCPFLAAADPSQREAFRCAWPGRLDVDVDARGGRFAQAWQVYADSWIVLPGSLEHWPREVTVNGAAAALVEREGRPQLRLAAGEWRIAGRFAWSARPANLPIAPATALVELVVDGRAVARPERPDGALVLGAGASGGPQPRQLDLQVYRLVLDEIPLRLVTRLRLNVAGDAREATLPRLLPDGFVPAALRGELPARLEPDGRLRVQVRPGRFELALDARLAGELAGGVLARPKGAANGVADAVAAPAEETWSFQGVDRLRVASLEGAEGVDPAQANVPGEWRALPAFRMTADAALRLVERSRGLATADDNRLTLSRRLWLDFDHGGYTAVDRIEGTMRRDWRLDARAPFTLESARRGAETLLVTEGAAAGVRGVELRSPAVELEAVSRVAGSRAALPASGWSARFERVGAELNLPPGHRLVAALGVDSAPGSWWERWGLWSAFGVCIVVALTYRLAGRAAAAIAFGALLLTYQEGPAYIWLWANALLALAAAGAAPEGRLRDWARRYRVAALALLAVALLPLLWGQLRLAVHPQLEAIASPEAASWGAAIVPAAAPPADMPAPPPPPEAAAGEAELQADVVDEMAVSRPMPRARLDRKAIASAAGGADAAVVVASEYAAAVATRYAPGTLLQAGPGLPDWSYRRYPLLWAGPVTAEDTVRFLYVGPVLLGAWRIAGVALLALWFAALLRLATGDRGGAWLRTGATAPPGTAAAASSALAALSPALLLAALAATGLAPTAARAASTPDPALLETLRQRLLAPPACVPDCAEILRARVEVDGERLSIVLEASALANVAVALPSAGDRWQVESASVDGDAGVVIAREGDGTPWLPLRAGARTIRLAGRIADVDALPLLFAQPPRTIEVAARGWDVGGVEGGRLLSGALELTRRRGAAPSGGGLATDAAAGGADFPPFVRVFREFTFGPEWSAGTIVRRVAPERAAFTVEVPLVAGESVLTAGLDVDAARRARVGLAAGQPQAGWASTLARTEALVLAAPPASANRAEVWRFVAGPEWALVFDGPPAVLPDEPDGAQWIYTYYPRPGETLSVGLRRPAAVPGATLAIDAVEHRLRVGTRSADATLSMRYRSTQGGRHVIALPPDARVTSVTVDGAPQQLRPERGELSLGLLPGTHRVEIAWESAQGVAAATRPPLVDLRSPAGNVRTTLELPADGRWILFALGRGAGVGPAVLYWSELLAFLALAWLLGRLPASPLRPWEWLVLGLGLSTQSWGVFAGVAAWLLALRWREGWRAERASRSAFNLVQLALAALSVVALSSLVFAGFQYGFLSTPDMGIVGAGSSGNVLQWFADRTAGPLPQPLVVSVPLWAYKALVFAWALAVAWLLAMRWLPWAWRAWSAGGYWRSKGEVSPASAP